MHRNTDYSKPPQYNCLYCHIQSNLNTLQATPRKQTCTNVPECLMHVWWRATRTNQFLGDSISKRFYSLHVLSFNIQHAKIARRNIEEEINVNILILSFAKTKCVIKCIFWNREVTN